MINKPCRIVWIDYLKGFLLIIVMIEHVGNIPSYLDLPVKYFGTMAMPGYFALSGYLYNVKSNFASLVKSKTMSLFVPYVCLSLLFMLLDHNLYDREEGARYLMSSLYRIFVEGLSSFKSTPLWFVLTLYLITIVSYPLSKLRNSISIEVILILMCSMAQYYFYAHGIKFQFNINSFLASFPLFLMGMIIHQIGLLNWNDKQNTWCVFCVCVLLSMILLLVCFKYELANPLHGCIPVYWTYILYSIFSVILLFFSFSRMHSILLGWVLTYISLNGMAFLGSHAYFQLYIINILRILKAGNTCIFYATSLFSILFSAFVALLFNKYAWMLVGKKSKKSIVNTLRNK